MVAPASANVIGKMANGIADDMLTTTILAAKCPKYVSPAMNTNMFENPIVQDNIKKLGDYGFHIIDPASGYLACGDTGAGKMPEPETLFSYIMKDLACEKDMVGKKVMVTAGPTQEKIDPVRYITNHSTGKMGYAIAENCMRRGAEVTLITGPVAITPPPFVKVVPVVSAADMAAAVKETAEQQDIIIKAAAVADYRPDHPVDEKVKKKDGDATLTMERTEDILSYLGAHKKPGQFLCGFSMETEHMLENSRAKLAKKNADMIVANNLKVAGAGFGTDTNVVTLITADDCRELEIMSKADVASAIVSEILNVGLNILLIPRFRENAAAFTTLLAELCSMMLCIRCSRGLVTVSADRRTVGSVLCGCAGIVLVCTGVKALALPNLICILAAVLGSVAAYAAILLGMKNPLVLEYLEKAKQKFRKIS